MTGAPRWPPCGGSAATLASITEQARDLPGEGIARDLPIKAVEAATMEEAALRQLRDNWQPGNVALLEQVQEARSQASLLLRETSIAIDELEELDKPEDQEAAEEFSDAFTSVDADWDAFHDAYETLLDDQYELGAAEMVERLKALIDELELIEDALDDLPSEAVTDDIAETLTAAVSEEAKGLKVLLGAFSRLARTEAAVMVPAAVIVPANGDEEEGESENGAAGSDMIPDVVSDGAPASTPMPMPVPTPTPTPTPMPTPTPYQAAPERRPIIPTCLRLWTSRLIIATAFGKRPSETWMALLRVSAKKIRRPWRPSPPLLTG